MSRQKPADRVVSAANRSADEKTHGLAGIKVCNGIGRRRSQSYGNPKSTDQSHRHGSHHDQPPARSYDFTACYSTAKPMSILHLVDDCGRSGLCWRGLLPGPLYRNSVASISIGKTQRARDSRGLQRVFSGMLLGWGVVNLAAAELVARQGSGRAGSGLSSHLQTRSDCKGVRARCSWTHWNMSDVPLIKHIATNMSVAGRTIDGEGE